MFKSYLQVFLFLALVAGVNWTAAHWVLSKPPPLPETEATPDQWQAPQLRFSNEAIVHNSRLNKLHYWDKQTLKQKKSAPKAVAKKPEKPTYIWKLIGIVGEGDTRHMLALNGKTKKIERYSIGAELPDGGRLLAILDNGVRVQDPKKNTAVEIQLHAPPS